MTTDFFEEQKDQSRVKANIVAAYFGFWLRIMQSMVLPKMYRKKIGHIDLFCGPGVYKDGSESTPILILRRIIESGIPADQLKILFFDKEPEYVRLLEERANALDGFDRISKAVSFISAEASEEVTEWLGETDIIPTLFFIDPFGYKAISLELIRNSVKSFACDCIFFFNYSRVNMAVTNKALPKPIEHFFGPELSEKVRERINQEGHDPGLRRAIIIEEIVHFFKDNGAYVQPFTFMQEGSRRVSHDLMLVTTHPVGIGAFKDIAAKHCFTDKDGIPHFEFCDSNASMFPVLSTFNASMADLKNHLLQEYSGKTLTRKQIFEKEQQFGPYLKKNYREALLQLEAEGKVTCDPPAEDRRKKTLSETVQITFP